MGVTVKSTTSEGDFEIVGGDVPVTLIPYKTEAEERAEKQILADRYLEPKVMINNSVVNDTTVGLQPFWGIFTWTSPEKLQADITRERKKLEPVCDLKVVSAIETAQESGTKITKIVLLGSGSMHVGGVCVCCEHDPEDAVAAIAEALELSMHFGTTLSPLPLVLQDPAYSNVEKKFLEGKAIKVLDDPDAFALIDSETLLIAPGVYWSMLHTVSKGTHPAAILTTDVPAAMRKIMDDAPPTSALEIQHIREVLEMFAEYARIGFHDGDLEETIRAKYGKDEQKVRKEIMEAKRAAPCLFVHVEQ